MLPSHASLRRSRPTRLSFFWDSWTKLWLSVNSPDETSSLESKTPCRMSPPLSRHFVRRWRWGRRAPFGPETLEDPGPHHRLRGHERALKMHENEGSWGAHARLLERGDAEVDRTWMWRLNPHRVAVMEPEDFVDSVRFRLGCAGPCEPVPCAACQIGSLDRRAPTRPVARWARPRVGTTRLLYLCTPRLSPVTARLRWRPLAHPWH